MLCCACSFFVSFLFCSLDSMDAGVWWYYNMVQFILFRMCEFWMFWMIVSFKRETFVISNKMKGMVNINKWPYWNLAIHIIKYSRTLYIKYFNLFLCFFFPWLVCFFNFLAITLNSNSRLCQEQRGSLKTLYYNNALDIAPPARLIWFLWFSYCGDD